MNARTPVHILTGFLGSGKTTLLRHILSDAAFHDTAVIINEFGEIGLDHLLVREVAEDVALLASGCVCCTVQDDLVSTLMEIQSLAATGKIPQPSRVVLETTGLADPGPVLRVLMTDRKLAPHYQAGTVITTADAVNGITTINSQHEAAIQLALADNIVITKTDLAPDRTALHAQIQTINPRAVIGTSSPRDLPKPDTLFASTPITRDLPAAGHHHDHGNSIVTFTVHLERPVAWPAFIDWLQLLLINRGDTILRVKGLLDVAGEPGPTVVNAVQHVVHAPSRLAAWPEGMTQGWLVFIARHLSAEAITRSIRSTYADTN